MKKLVVPFIIIPILVFLINGCLNDIEETPLEITQTILPAPVGLSALIGDGSVTLRWKGVTGAQLYNVYRMTGLNSANEKISGRADTFLVDTDLRNGQEYYYLVAAVGTEGLEGRRTEYIRAVPSVYSILINGGTGYTGNRLVVLSITAPITTALMKISNYPGMSPGSWELFGNTREWELSDMDGVRSIYAVFQDENGSISSVIEASIELDRYSMISDITFTPQPPLYAPGATIHFVMQVEDDELGGSGWITIEQLSGTIKLYDDGRGGDPVAEDGSYEADYTFPESLRGLDLGVAGEFTDRAGNESPPFEAVDMISFTDPPAGVQLLGAIDSTTSSITIKWSESNESNFSAYRIYRSDLPALITGQDPDPKYFIRGLDNRTQTSYPDGELIEGDTYYYRIFVVNDLEEMTASNEISASTFDAYPAPVVLDTLSSIGTDRVTLTWSTCQATDFESYRIYRATSPGVTESSLLVDTINERELTWYDDSGLDMGSYTYYYRVLVFDQKGKSSRSNEVSTP